MKHNDYPNFGPKIHKQILETIRQRTHAPRLTARGLLRYVTDAYSYSIALALILHFIHWLFWLACFNNAACAMCAKHVQVRSLNMPVERV